MSRHDEVAEYINGLVMTMLDMEGEDLDDDDEEDDEDGSEADDDLDDGDDW